MRDGMPGVELDGTGEFFFQTHPIPVVQPHMCERRVALAQIGFEPQRLAGRSLGFVKRFRRGHDSSAREHRVGVRDAVVGRRVAGIVADRLLEALDAIAHSILGAFVPGMAATQIQLVGLRINGPIVWLRPLRSANVK
jgi:hypothetical protein